MMMRHNRDVRGKTKRSFRDKQVTGLVRACNTLEEQAWHANARERNARCIVLCVCCKHAITVA